MIELFERRLAGWKRNFLSKRGRYTLIKSTMANLPIYFLSLITIPVKVATRLEAIQCKFLWGDSDEGRKYRLVKREDVKESINFGGSWN